MDGNRIQAERGYRLDPPGHSRGVSCDENGPALGPIRLLAKSATGFEPRPVEELNALFNWTFAEPMDCNAILPGLRAVARALNEGNLPRAMIATQFLHLPYLDETQSKRASEACELFKAAVDDPKCPGWPAGTPGGLGGKFRPLNAAIDAATMELARRLREEKAERAAIRELVRAGLRAFINWRRVARLLGEAGADLIPFVDTLGAVATVADVAQMSSDFVKLMHLREIALEFAKKGPYTLNQLRVSKEDISFPSFDAFKKIDLVKRFGPAPDGYEYHHIIEQNAGDDFPASELNSTRNIVLIPKLFHEEINSEYSQLVDQARMRLRQCLKGQSAEDRYAIGVEVMREIGILW